MDPIQELTQIQKDAEDEFQRAGSGTVYLKAIFRALALYIRVRLTPHPYDPSTHPRRQTSASRKS